MGKVIPIVTAVIGVILAVVGAIVLWAVLPSAIRNKVTDEMYIRNKTGEAYERFEKLPIPLQWKINFFHVTNPGDFNGSLTSLKFKEVGPYVYDEIREKVKIEMHDDLNWIEYEDKKTYVFNPKLSGKGLSANDSITIIHIGLALEKLYLANPFFSGLIKGFTLTETVQNIAFDGVAALAGQALFKCPGCLSNTKTVNTGKKDIKELGQFFKYGFNDNKTIPFWENTKRKGKCNTLTGTDGTQFHPDVKESDTLVVFEPMLCRTITFKKGLSNQSPYGIDTLRFYAIQENFAQSPENECFCYEDDPKKCPGGALNLKFCPPAADSHAEIMASNPYYQSNLDLLDDSGLLSLVAKKDVTLEKYGTILDVEPYTGLALGAKKRVQLNALLKKGSHQFVMNLAKEKMIAPLLWIEEAGDVDQKNADKLKDKIFGPKKTFTGILIAVMALGVLLVAIAGGVAYFKK